MLTISTGDLDTQPLKLIFDFGNVMLERDPINGARWKIHFDMPKDFQVSRNGNKPNIFTITKLRKVIYQIKAISGLANK